MKTIAILWNSMENNFSEALEDIRKFSTIYDYFKIDLSSHFAEFITDIYPNNHKWKTDYKIKILNNQYKKNEVILLFLEVPDSEKVYVERKKRYLYENVEKLKMFMRNKYMKKILNYCYDNIFHMTDDEEEYLQTLQVIKKYLILNFINNQARFMNLDGFLHTVPIYDKFLFADGMFMYKKVKDNSWELYSTLFIDKIAEMLGIKCAKNIPATYNNSQGLVTFNFINNDEIFIDGSHIIDFNITGNSDLYLSLSMDTIVKYNNLEILSNFIKDYCAKNGLKYRKEISDSFMKMYIFDIIILGKSRNPNNWGIIINKKNYTVRFAPLYNNEMGIFNEDINNDLIEGIDISIFTKYLSRLDDIDIDKVFYDIEKTRSITIPESFKSSAKKKFIQNIDSLNSITQSKTKPKIKTKKNRFRKH